MTAYTGCAEITRWAVTRLIRSGVLNLAGNEDILHVCLLVISHIRAHPFSNARRNRLQTDIVNLQTFIAMVFRAVSHFFSFFCSQEKDLRDKLTMTEDRQQNVKHIHPTRGDKIHLK